MYRFYIAPTSLQEALALKAQHGAEARILAGGTDLLLELEHGVRKAPLGGDLGVIDLSRIPGLSDIWEENGLICLGPLVTHNQCVASPLIVQQAFPLARACWEVGAPQIRNRATVAGNVITPGERHHHAAAGAGCRSVTLESAERGRRTLRLADFCPRLPAASISPTIEILVRISVPPLGPQQEGAYVKLGLRRAQAISVVNVAVVIEHAGPGAPVTRAAISLGASRLSWSAPQQRK